MIRENESKVIFQTLDDDIEYFNGKLFSLNGDWVEVADGIWAPAEAINATGKKGEKSIKILNDVVGAGFGVDVGYFPLFEGRWRTTEKRMEWKNYDYFNPPPDYSSLWIAGFICLIIGVFLISRIRKRKKESYWTKLANEIRNGREEEE